MIDGSGNIRHLATIADHCHIGRTVPQRVCHCSVGFLSQSADHCGGLAGCETAIHLAREGKQVALVEMRSELSPRYLRQHGIPDRRQR